VDLRAALESAVQLRRGDEMNRQAEMANTTTKCCYRSPCNGVTCYDEVIDDGYGRSAAGVEKGDC
jgi:hypothetical protein